MVPRYGIPWSNALTIEEAEQEREEVRQFLDGLANSLCPECKGQQKAEVWSLSQLGEMNRNFDKEEWNRWQAGPDCPACGGTGKRVSEGGEG